MTGNESAARTDHALGNSRVVQAAMATDLVWTRRKENNRRKRQPADGKFKRLNDRFECRQYFRISTGATQPSPRALVSGYCLDFDRQSRAERNVWTQVDCQTR